MFCILCGETMTEAETACEAANGYTEQPAADALTMGPLCSPCMRGSHTTGPAAGRPALEA